jgi:hypothetical protein
MNVYFIGLILALVGLIFWVTSCGSADSFEFVSDLGRVKIEGIRIEPTK